ncbi:hypothetical protein [Roseibium sp.]|uniref:hypothetical protein n=1 Tax=Roseibium sp. TaxID=1936156 RepID=UPI003D131DBB
MAVKSGKDGRKSVGGNKPLRSRGFLSQPGASVSTNSGEAADPTKHHRSRGARAVSATRDGKPRDLSVKPVIKPYTLEDK